VSGGLRPPGPRALTPLGHLLAFRRDVIGFLSRVAAEYGDVVSFAVGPYRVVLLNDPEYIRDVLQTNHQNFVKGRPLQLARHLLGEGLLTSEGELHRRQSRTVQPAFHAARIAAYGATMTDCASRWSARWRADERLDMMTEMVALATAIAGRTMFSWDVDSGAGTRIGRALADAMSLFSRASVPFAELLLKLPLPSSRRFSRAKAELDSAIYGLIAERRRDGTDHGDVLSMLLLARDRDGVGAGMTDRQVRDEALTLFLTGLDTTSLALTWLWYLLSRHPTVEANLHAEIDGVLDGRTPTIDDLESLPYTRLVLTESMRLYPPIYAIARQAIEPFTVGPYTVPAGTLVLMSPYVTQRDPRFYPDPERFHPERWSHRTEPRPPRFTYFPFGGGPRGCIGQSYAMQEAMLVIATLARDWRMRLVPGHPIAFRPLINLRPRYGMPMVLERRG
jgi:cytochrome P450